MAGFPPAVSDFKAFFNREFIYGDGLDTVEDGDITTALNMAGMKFNPRQWLNDTEASTAYLWLAAHFLEEKIQGAGGLSALNRGRGVNNKGGGAIQTKSVGNVSVSYTLPDWVVTSPIFSSFMSTGFGQMYSELAWPRTVGNIAVVAGGFTGNNFAGMAPPLVITTQTLPNGAQSVPYSQQILSSGGVAPITWSKQTGTLPTGLTLAPSGILSGTPTTPGTYTFRVVAVDRQQQATGMNYTVVIS